MPARRLRSHQPCFWKVRVWDKDGRPSAWSKPALWSMGLLDPSDWARAEWIGSDKSRQIELPEAPFEGAKWIWHAGDKGANKPKGHRLFVTTLRLPPDARVEKAELIATADDFFMFTINGNLVINGQAGTGGWDHPKSADVTAQLKPGAENTIRVEVNNTSAGPAGLLAKLNVTTADGKTITLVTDGTWKTTDNPGANWHNRPLDTQDWPAAEVLGDYGMAPWGKLRFANLVLPPPSYLRTRSRSRSRSAAPRLYATALGIFDVHLNGQRVGDDYFNPGWTDYTKRVYYRAFDVTGQVRAGRQRPGRDPGRRLVQRLRRLRQEARPLRQASRGSAPCLHLELADGTTADVVTGPDWKAATGPIHEADFLMGETYDARARAWRGWDAPGFDDSRWSPVDVGAELNPVVQWHPGAAGARLRRAQAAVDHRAEARRYVFDLGQNFAGDRPAQDRPASRARRSRCAMPSGSTPTARSTRPTSARPASTDTYICSGRREETWEPRFTFHGFQYVEVTGLKSPPDRETITGIALSQRHAGRRQLRVLRPDAQPAAQQYLLDPAGQLHRHPDRLPPARRAAGLDRRCPGLHRARRR